MSRDGSGNYILPAGNPVVTGTTISSTVQNNTLADIASALTQSVSKDGQTAMTGSLNMGSNALNSVSTLNAALLAVSTAAGGNVLTANDGTVFASITFNGTALTFGPTSAHTLNLATNGSNRIAVNSAGNVTVAAPSSGITAALTAVASGIPMSLTDGTVTATVTFNGTAFTIGPTSAHTLNIATNGSSRISVTSAGNGTIAAPSSGVTWAMTAVAAGTAWTITDGTVTGAATLGSTRVNIGASSNHGWALLANNLAVLTSTAGGALAVPAPTTGTAMTITGAAASAALVVNGSASTPANNIGNSGTAFTLDCSKSNVHYVTMTGNVAAGSLTISNLQDGQTVNLYLTQDGTGTRTLGNPTGVKWPGGTVGVLTTTAGALDLITFQKANGITTATLIKAFA